MSETYCDIIPQTGGWAFVFEGRHSAVYPSYRLALEAARNCSEEHVAETRRATILRQQDLSGRMQEVKGRSDAWSPVGRSSGPVGSAGQV